MSSDDLTRKLPDDEGRTTQPMIADVLRLLEEVKQSMEDRFDASNARLDQTNARLDQTNARLDQTEARITELSEEMRKGFLQLSDEIARSRLHSAAEYHDLLRRIRELESKAS